MKIGEIFVELGMKGGEKLKDSLAETNKGMKDLSSKTLETQAHLIALTKVSVALGASIEEISRRGSEAGKSLELYHQFSGQSVIPVQQMAHSLAIATDESVKLAENIGQVFATISAEGGSKYFGLLGIDLQKIVGLQQQMNALQAAAKSPQYKGNPMMQNLLNKALIENGLSPDLIGQLRRTGNIFTSLGSEATTSPGEAKAAAAISDQWTNLGNDLSALNTKLAVVFGPPLVKSLTDFTLALSKWTGWVEETGKEHPVFKKATEQGAGLLGLGALGAGLGGAVGLTGIAGLTVATGGVAGLLIALAGAATWFAEHDVGLFGEDNKSTGLPNLGSKRPSEFVAEDLAAALAEQGRQQLMLTINQTLLPNTSGRKETRTSTQTVGFDSKGGQTNQTYQQLQNNQ
jgi:hypothetical protein